MPSIDQNLQPFTGNGDVSIWVKNSRVGQKSTDRQTSKQTNKQTNKVSDNMHKAMPLSSTSHFSLTAQVTSAHMPACIFVYIKKYRKAWMIHKSYSSPLKYWNLVWVTDRLTFEQLTNGQQMTNFNNLVDFRYIPFFWLLLKPHRLVFYTYHRYKSKSMRP